MTESYALNFHRASCQSLKAFDRWLGEPLSTTSSLDCFFFFIFIFFLAARQLSNILPENQLLLTESKWISRDNAATLVKPGGSDSVYN